MFSLLSKKALLSVLSEKFANGDDVQEFVEGEFFAGELFVDEAKASFQQLGFKRYLETEQRYIMQLCFHCLPTDSACCDFCLDSVHPNGRTQTMRRRPKAWEAT